MPQIKCVQSRCIITAITFAVTMLALLAMPATPVSADDTESERGRITERPSDTMVGKWTIGDDDYWTTEETAFDESEGPLVQGACAKVIYHEEDDLDIVDSLRTLDDNECRGSDDDDDRDDDDRDDDDRDDDERDDDDRDDDAGDDDRGRSDDALRAYGLLGELPSGMTEGDPTGSWMIGGLPYLVNGETELDQEHGPFVANTCVKVKYVEDGETRTALEIETEHEYRCGGSDDDSGEDDGDARGPGVRGHLYGELQSFPPGFIGEWTIGDETFMVDAQTELKQERGEFIQGILVKVHFFEALEGDQAGVRFAVEIETKARHDDDDDDDGDDDDGDDNEGRDDDDDRSGWERGAGRAYGLIASFPSGTAGPIGDWVIGGVPYAANARTKFYQVEGIFAVDACVLVRYKVDQNGDRIARVIKTDADACGAPDGEDDDKVKAKLFGPVEALPEPVDGNRNFVGSWTVAGTLLTADENTMFKESKGLLVVGAFVKVYYKVDGETKYMVSIETLVPPGAGERIHQGRIERMGDNVAASSVTADETWVIDGQSYRVTDGTDVDETDGLLQVGSLVEINSYIDADGTEVATQIRNAAESNTVFLPLVNRE